MTTSKPNRVLYVLASVQAPIHKFAIRLVTRSVRQTFASRARLIAVGLVLAVFLTTTPSATPIVSQKTQQHASSSVRDTSFSTRIIRTLNANYQWVKSLVSETVGASTTTAPAWSIAPPVVAYVNPPMVLDAPSNLSVISTTNSQIELSWSAPSGTVNHYQVERSQSVHGPFLFAGTSPGTTFTDGGVTLNHAYLYRVRAVGNSGPPSAPSNMALGTAISFEFSSLQGEQIRARHIHDLRTAVNAVRAVAGRAAVTFGDRSNLVGLFIEAADVQILRDKLAEALNDLNIQTSGFTDPALSTGATGTPIKGIHLEQLQARSSRGSSSSSGPLTDLFTARLDPMNQTGGGGENPLSRNYNWNLPIVSLPGRAGMNLGLTLSYNSLVWTRSGNFISFDDDQGFPSPGFRLGFPVIQQIYFNSEVGTTAFILIGSDGGRTELRQVGSSLLYESADSTHLLLDITDLATTGSMIMRSTDGTQLKYVPIGNAYECVEIKDSNGNFITINYNTSGAALGRISNIHDTLNRIVAFNYDTNGWLTSITQGWKRPEFPTQQITHTWATFDYFDQTIDTNFDGLTVIGPADNTTRKVLSRVTLADNSTTVTENSHFDFSYTSWGQVWKISSYAADNHLLNYRAYNLPIDGSVAFADCPRFTQRRDWGQWANGDTDKVPDGSEEAITSYMIPVGESWTMPNGAQANGTRARVTHADQPAPALNKRTEEIYFEGLSGSSTGWRRSLPALVKTSDHNGTLQRQVMTTWEQDNETLSYELNPRVKETRIYDPALQNPKLTRVTYQSFTPLTGSNYKLPQDVFEYDHDATSVLRSTRTEYVDGDESLKGPYLARRILGLVKEKKLYEGDVTSGGSLKSRVGLSYDEGGSIQGSDAPVQHDNTNYTANFIIGRGNVTSVTRHNVQISGASTASKLKYNTSGAVVSSKDALNNEVKIDYADSFSDGDNSRGTFAYPTTVTDPDNFYSTTKYNFDFGSMTYRQTPPPNASTQPGPAPSPVGPAQTFTYDDLGRLERTTSLVNNAYTRHEYPTSKIRLETFSTLVAGQEARAFTITDGFGRTIATATTHPATSGTVARYDTKRITYDVLGRAIKTSNPAESSANGDDPGQWQLVEGDAGSSWVYTQQTYDWKGRPKVTTNTDNTTKSVVYEGCGCAGGEVLTLNDEGTILNGVTKTRQQKIFSDVIGRTVKSEVWNFEGTGPGGVGRSLYSTTVNNYNARDQVTLVRQFKGAAPTNYLTDLSCPTGTCQKTELDYDGYGRLETKHVPEQKQNPYVLTTWTYNADDTVNTVTDGRGAVTEYGYGTSGNNRRLVKTISHTLTGSLPAINVSFEYDVAGNRKSMSHFIDGIPQDNVNYTYDQLSRLTSETRHINALINSPTSGNYTIGYEYTLAGQVSSVTDPFSSTTNLNYDAIGRTESVTGSYAGVSHTYANDIEYRAWGAVKRQGTKTITYNNRLQPEEFRLSQYRYDYSYHPDGKLKQLTDLDDMVGQPSQVTFHYMSRSYGYDQAGRISSVDGSGNPIVNGGFVPAPFVGYYGYDEFNNMISRSGYYALNPNSGDSATFVDNKRTSTGWSYDEDGRVLTSFDTATNTSQTWSYDAAGNKINISEVSSGVTSSNTLSYDGDGELLYESVTTPQSTKADYLIRSTVLGTVLTKLDASGNKDITYVPANGLAFPMQTKDFNGNPSVGGVWRDVTGLQESGKAVDPFGARIQNVQPPSGGGAPPNMPVYGATYNGVSWSQFTNANNYSSGCMLDGVRTDCNRVREAIGKGNAAQCPDNMCGPRQILPGVWGVFTGSGFWMSDGSSSHNLFSDDVEEFGSLLDALTSHLGPPDKKKKKKGKQPKKQEPNVGADVGGGAGLFRQLPLTIERFEPDEERQIRATLRKLFSDKCAAAYRAQGLKTPLEVTGKGLVIRPSTDLINFTAKDLNLVSDSLRLSYREEFFGGSGGQAGTIRAILDGKPQTTDGRGQIYIDRVWGFNGESWFDRTFSLQDVMSHEFIHHGGQKPKPGWLYGIRHDLAGYRPHDGILAACR